MYHLFTRVHRVHRCKACHRTMRSSPLNLANFGLWRALQQKYIATRSETLISEALCYIAGSDKSGRNGKGTLIPTAINKKLIRR